MINFCALIKWALHYSFNALLFVKIYPKLLLHEYKLIIIVVLQIYGSINPGKVRKYENTILQHLLIGKCSLLNCHWKMRIKYLYIYNCSLLVNDKYKIYRQSETKNRNIALTGNFTLNYTVVSFVQFTNSFLELAYISQWQYLTISKYHLLPSTF